MKHHSDPFHCQDLDNLNPTLNMDDRFRIIWPCIFMTTPMYDSNFCFLCYKTLNYYSLSTVFNRDLCSVCTIACKNPWVSSTVPPFFPPFPPHSTKYRELPKSEQSLMYRRNCYPPLGKSLWNNESESSYYGVYSASRASICSIAQQVTLNSCLEIKISCEVTT